MTKRISFLAAAVVCASFALVVLPLATVPAFAEDSQSITDLTPLTSPTPTPEEIVSLPTPTPEPTPEALPTTGTSPYLLIALAVVLIASVGIYAVMPRHQD